MLFSLLEGRVCLTFETVTFSCHDFLFSIFSQHSSSFYYFCGWFFFFSLIYSLVSTSWTENMAKLDFQVSTETSKCREREKKTLFLEESQLLNELPWWTIRITGLLKIHTHSNRTTSMWQCYFTRIPIKLKTLQVQHSLLSLVTLWTSWSVWKAALSPHF